MSTQAQTKAQALNHKLESEARATLDEIEREHLRGIAKKAYQCAVTCYDKAGTRGSTEALENCVRSCQMPHQQSQNYVQQEVNQYQNRLNRAMQECSDRARDEMKPGYENDAKAMAKVEDKLLRCMQKTVDEYIGMLKPLKSRILTTLQQAK